MKVLVADMMTSEESESENDVIVVKPLRRVSVSSPSGLKNGRTQVKSGQTAAQGSC